MAELVNRTPFSVAELAFQDSDGAVHAVFAVCASFAIKADGSTRPADEPLPVPAGDVPWSDAFPASIRYEGEMAPLKSRVDVVVNASAWAPRGRPVARVRVSLRVGEIGKQLLVSGDRFWRSTLFGGGPSSPRKFRSLPIRWERAWGGGSAREDAERPKRHHAANPVGVGHRGARSADPEVESEVPNVEWPRRRVRSRRSRATPAGFGVVARTWQPRLGLAGTYDDAWVAHQFPLLARDFDPEYFQMAPRDQQMAKLAGGELVELDGVSPDGPLRFELPTLDVPLTLWSERARDRVDVGPDTVLIEPDLRRVSLIGRHAVRVPPGRAPLYAVVFGAETRGMERARRHRKPYRSGGVRSLEP